MGVQYFLFAWCSLDLGNQQQYVLHHGGLLDIWHTPGTPKRSFIQWLKRAILEEAFPAGGDVLSKAKLGAI